MTHDLPVCTLMFAAIAHGAADEIVTRKFHYDFAIGDKICLREYDEIANTYTRAEPVTVRIVRVSSHYSDLSRIPAGHYLVSFVPLKPAASVPVAPKIGSSRLSVKTFHARDRDRVRSSARAKKAKPKIVIDAKVSR